MQVPLTTSNSVDTKKKTKKKNVAKVLCEFDFQQLRTDRLTRLRVRMERQRGRYAKKGFSPRQRGRQVLFLAGDGGLGRRARPTAV